MLNARPRLSPYSRLLLCQRVATGRPVAHVAAEMGVSRATAHKWLARWRAEGPDGLRDRSSRPHSSPRKLPEQTEQRVPAIRAGSRKGPVWIARQLGLHASTVGRVLRRHHVPLLAHLDPTTGAVIRGHRASHERYEYDEPGGLVHIDVKKLGRIPPGGGWRVHGRSEAVRARGAGYDYVHAAVDDHSRAVYAEILPGETAADCAGFLTRALAFFAAHGVTVARVMTDNALAYRRSFAWQQVLTERRITHVFTKPHCPWTNGKVERVNRTLATEWAYRQAWRSNQDRRDALPAWLEYYNTRRAHTALGGQPPISRLPVNDLVGRYS